jgi:carboxyl-terminal processing protease
LRRVLREAPGHSQPFEALILDLRGNAGGLLDSAVEVCDLFLDEGVIVSTCGKDGEIRSSYSANKPNTAVSHSIPIAVLVNTYSASASEIVAACLQDYRRAVVVGSRTWGKGTVQNIFDLEGGRSALKLTTAGYLRPSGKNIHKPKDARDDQDWGVQPDKDFEVQLPDEETEQLFRQRRQRDVSSPVATPNKTDSPAGTGTTTEGGPEKQEKTEPPIDDRQLRRAIQYLEQQITSLPARREADAGKRGAEVRPPGKTSP